MYRWDRFIRMWKITFLFGLLFSETHVLIPRDVWFDRNKSIQYNVSLNVTTNTYNTMFVRDVHYVEVNCNILTRTLLNPNPKCVRACLRSGFRVSLWTQKLDSALSGNIRGSRRERRWRGYKLYANNTMRMSRQNVKIKM